MMTLGDPAASDFFAAPPELSPGKIFGDTFFDTVGDAFFDNVGDAFINEPTEESGSAAVP